MLDPLLKRHFYCSELARDSREAIFGTGGTGKMWVLLEYPGGWEPRAITDSQLSIEVKDYLEALTKAPLRAKTLLMKQDRRPLNRITVFVVMVREIAPVAYRLELTSYEELLDLDFHALAAGDIPPRAAVVDHPLFMICTHGRRDKCCAKFGYPIYRLMHAHEPRGTWQVSHVGGDRFASNVVCFPHGIFYGHVAPADVDAIMESYLEQSLYLRNYRGRACYPKEIQAAEYFVRSASGVLGAERLMLTDFAKTDEQPTWSASFHDRETGIAHQVQFTRKQSEFQNYMTCHATEQKTVAQFTLLDYRGVSIDADELTTNIHE